VFVERKIALAVLAITTSCREASHSGADGGADEGGSAAEGPCQELVVDRDTIVPVAPPVACSVAHAKESSGDLAGACRTACANGAITLCDVDATYGLLYAGRGADDCPAVDAGTVDLTCYVTHPTTHDPPCSAGRRPSGLIDPSNDGTLAGWLAAASTLEAASVVAFRILARDLERLGAPEHLVRGARRAARQEERHAAIMACLARLRGREPERPRVRVVPPRDVVAVALDNVVEGVVRETYGAAVNLFSAERAADPELRAAFVAIGQDECTHAAWSFEVAAWSRSRLDESERRLCDDAFRRALAALRREISADRTSPHLRIPLGLPSTAEAIALLDRLESDLLAAVPS
jgi:hypothetical protein